MNLSICYMTARANPCLEWFLDSLRIELEGSFDGVEVIIVDYLADPYDGSPAKHEARRDYVTSCIDAAGIPHENFNWLAPKKNPWQGICRQTREDWFNAGNARNTALCFARGKWIAFVDDLSVLRPGWGASVREAMNMPGHVTFGRYRKVKQLCVVGGEVISFEDHPAGHDSRMKHLLATGWPETRPRQCGPEWLFGCSLIGEVESFLNSNGWVETITAGLGFEDCVTGINMSKRGITFRYDPRMLTWESEERHEDGSRFKRSDYGQSPNDKSHAVLKICQDGDGWAANDFFNGMDLRELRAHVMLGGRFPTPPPTMREFFTGRLLYDL